MSAAEGDSVRGRAEGESTTPTPGALSQASAARAAYGLPDLHDARPSVVGRVVLALLALFLVVAVGAVWLVAVPALTDETRTARSCEVVVLASGQTRCVKDPSRARARPARR